ncbi:helix-turn-helix domain-containing protein [Antrihabitans sp. YC2-6]|nr:helix-turn-helix domain-containing protein [Antrihabitans sp. YC2-6]
MGDSREVRQLIRDRNVLIESLFAEQDTLVERVRAALGVEHSVNRRVRSDELHNDMARDVVRILSAARGGRAVVNGDDVADLAIAGEAWARQGVPVDEMLRAWQIGVEVVVGHVRDLGRRLGVEDADLLEFVSSALAWSDIAVVTAAKGHRTAEIALAIAEEERRAGFVRGVLFGTVPASDLRVTAEAHGIDPTREYVAIRARLADGVNQRKLEQQLGFHDSSQRRQGLCALVDGAIAGFLSEPPSTIGDGLAGVGAPRPLKYVAESYRQATRALMTVQACGLHGAHDLESLGLRAAVAMDSDVSDIIRARYLDPLSPGDSARELIATVRAYLACDMHVERTATRLFVHQNTVRYRLARFEELTGASLRETQVIVEVWWAIALSEMSL